MGADDDGQQRRALGHVARAAGAVQRGAGAVSDKRLMTELETKAAKALWRCTFLPGSYNKHFARAMDTIARSDEPLATEKQCTNLWRLVWRYRRQIQDNHLIDLAYSATHSVPLTRQEKML